MIIDCHGHYTTAPSELGDYRENQKNALSKNKENQVEKGEIRISDDQIRESLENKQLKLQKERGTDLTLFSPRASWMGHHVQEIKQVTQVKCAVRNAGKTNKNCFHQRP